MQLYRILFSENAPIHESEPQSVKDGYLASEGQYVLLPYQQALKKAIKFHAAIVKYGKDISTSKLNVLQICRGDISKELLKELDGRETFSDSDGSLSELLYYGSIFETIGGELFEAAKIKGTFIDDTLEIELNVLISLCSGYEYIMLIN